MYIYIYVSVSVSVYVCVCVCVCVCICICICMYLSIYVSMYLCIVCKISSYNILYIHYSLLFFPPESSSLPNMGHLQRRGGGDPRGQQTVRIHQLLDHALHLMRSATTEKTHGKQLLSYCKSGRTWVPTGFLQSVWPKRTLSVHKHMTTYVNLPSIFLPNMSIYIYIYTYIHSVHAYNNHCLTQQITIHADCCVYRPRLGIDPLFVGCPNGPNLYNKSLRFPGPKQKK